MGISIPINIDVNDNNLEKYNKSSDYYNDICSKTSSESGTDISLTDRKNNFVDNNMTLCEEDCDLINYNKTIKKVECSCLIKISLPLIEDIKFDKDKLYKSFTDIKNIANLNFMKCYKEVLNKKSLRKNYGFFIHIVFIIFYVITLILFYCKYFFSLKNIIKKIKKTNNKVSESKKKKDNLITISNNNINNYNNKDESNKKRKIKFGRNKNTDNFPPKRNKNIKDIILNRKESYKSDNNDNKNKYKFKNITTNKSKNNKKKKHKKHKKIIMLNDNELNSLIYKKAIKLDKRTYFQYYFSLLKVGNLLVFSFYINNNDYNVQIIKMFLFFFFFSLHLTINALFFNDANIHQIYLDEGSYNFLYQIPQVIYSSLISAIITILIKYLSLSEKNIVEMKKTKKAKKLKMKEKKLIKTLKVKFALFFIFAFILLLLFSYYITCFCGIYTNTQIHLIKDSLISFGLSLIYPFGLCLIPGIFRIPSLRAKKKDKIKLYNFSQFLEGICV